MRAIAGPELSATFAALRRGRFALPLAAALCLPAAARAQSSACDDFKRTLAERIEAGGVRGYALETVPTGTPVPPGARAVGNCDGGAFTIVYRRWASARPAAEAAAPGAPAAERAAPPEPAPTSTAKPVPTPTTTPAVAAASAAKPAAKPAATPAAMPTGTPAAMPAAASAARAGARPKPGVAPAPAPADAAPSPAAAAAAVDGALARLAALPFTFDSPHEMVVGDRVRVRLTADDDAALAALQGAPGAGVVARRLSARLVGAGFRVSALSPELASLAAADGARWQWDVEPDATGTHTLQLTLDAEFLVDGAPVRRHVRSFERRTAVVPPLADRAATFAATHWGWLLLLTLLPLGGIAWAWQARRSAYDSAGLPRGPKLRL